MFQFGNTTYDINSLTKTNEEKVCSFCNTTLSDFYNTGIVGCANCYKVFENEIKQMIFSSQGTISHNGKVSSKLVSKIKIKEKIEELEKKKEEAVKEEDFITAESLKTQIEKLKGAM